MTFFDEYASFDISRAAARIYSASPADVSRALAAETASFDDYLVLLSPAADAHASAAARKSRALTQKHFGRNIALYSPLYLSNECSNQCRYCGFNASSGAVRKTLSPSEIIEEADFLKSRGIESVLLLTGESPSKAGVPYVEDAVSALSGKFAFVGLEIFPASVEEYRRFVAAGASGLTIYQETYDASTYADVHPSGLKRDFRRRLETPDRACEAGFRKIGLGALLGLYDWRLDAAFLGLHARYLCEKYWRSEVSVSFPRLRNCGAGFSAPCAVSDGAVARMMFAMRIFLPQAGIVLSTRESAGFRDSLIGWGVTMMSAASRTNPGGYAAAPDSLEQFEVMDSRAVPEVVDAIEKKGLFPVFKDWDKSFAGARYEN